jgi:hypothetical protein
MNPCAPHLAVVHRAAAIVRARPRRVVHYVASHKTHTAAGHHAATGHPAAHLPVRRHPRPAVHHAPPPAPDTGACGASGIARKLRAGLAGGPAAVGGLVAGGAIAGIGAAAALVPDGPGTPHGGFGGGGSGGPGFGGPGFGGPGFRGPGFGGPGFGGPGGGPQGPLPGTPGTSHVDTPPPAVSVPEPSSLLVLAMALLVLVLTRWARARR